MLLAELVEIARAVAETSSRNAKVSFMAGLLQRAEPGQIEAAVGYLAGEPRQGRIGVGWATAYRQDVAPAAVPSLTIAELDDAMTRILATTGPGSVGSRGEILASIFSRATTDEADYIRRLFTGEMRQGALDGVVTEAVARAAEVPAAAVRRAVMLTGDLGRSAVVALTAGLEGLGAIGLELLRPLQPMLASIAKDVTEALAATGPASVEWKLDGIRIQAHRAGGEVRLYA
ncbi:MAG: ATP-dependent DNA ligase, partial [Actinomycetota bacterium]